MEFVAALFGERHADQAAAELGHEVDGFRRDFFGGHGEVAFVFAVFVVDQDDHAAVANFFDGFFDGGKWWVLLSHGLVPIDGLICSPMITRDFWLAPGRGRGDSPRPTPLFLGKSAQIRGNEGDVCGAGPQKSA